MTKDRKTAKKGKGKRGGQRVSPKHDTTTEAGHKGRFEQLLDDAIFGVKKKNPRG